MMSKVAVAGLLVALAAALLTGCGGGNEQVVFQNVIERAAWNATGTRLAFTSVGGNAVNYVYSLSNTGAGLLLLTPSDDDADLTDEGGKQPAWSPDDTDLAIVARRGGGQAIFTIDPDSGSSTRETKLTDDTVPGADAQPSWSPDSTRIVFVTTKDLTGRWEIHIMNRDGSGNVLVPRDASDTNDAQWPVFTPDGLNIIYQSGIAGPGAQTTLRQVAIAGGPTTELDPVGNEGFRREAPSISPDGVDLIYHSNVEGDFDIWDWDRVALTRTNLTNDTRSDGYPIWNRAGDRIAFNRDRELWVMNPDGTNQQRLTQRFEQ